MIVITTDLINASGIEASEFEGLTSITLQVEGVQIGILVKQRSENRYKISVRTTEEIDACAFATSLVVAGMSVLLAVN